MSDNSNFKDPHITPSQSVATIANGQSVSSSVDCSRGGLAGIIVPTGFPAGNITFQASIDGINFYEYKDSVTGNPIGVTVTTDNTLYRVLLSDTVAVSHIKVVSPGVVGAETKVQCLLRYTG